MCIGQHIHTATLLWKEPNRKMKFAVCLLVLLPMVYCASIEERFLFTGLHIDEVVEILGHYLGSDTSEAACEAACPSILSEIPGGSLAAPLLCSPACKEVMRRGK
ncbi:uncharacterized protein LOC127858825 [Dreissena polymorpha]|uniref:Uncharacterized protein n=1 Tax=Dreissena polymorpha TaxID=45954 RepID=A0A9D3YVZ0_DREPO|nr:uncharacterized protein LOC127858825 [Dreissena polymorpha]KAH3706086.1 hypothetical protein DPMN_065466 [Dreissena polymorpha]